MQRRITLENKTQYDDKILYRLLNRAMLRAECEPPVTVSIQYHRSIYITGLAESYKRTKVKIAGVHKAVFTNGGIITIKTPNPVKVRERYPKEWKNDGFRAMAKHCAELLYMYAVHEFKHVADFQMKRYFDPDSVPYEQREQEKRAVITETLAMRAVRNGDDPETREAIRALAAEIRKHYRGDGDK